MDFARFIIYLILFVFSLTPLAHAAEENVGVVFLHGTSDHRLDAEGGYWKKEFITDIASGLPNPNNYLIVHCDFSQMMWHDDATGCFVDQFLEFVKNYQLTKVVVYTHSHGANIIRWVLSNPTYDPRYIEVSKTIEKVVAIAPSSGGTILADEVIDGNIFSEGVGWLLGFRTDAVKQQRIADMALLNDEVLLGSVGRPNLPKPFYVVVGTDVTASPFTSASYCNGYSLNLALKLTKTYLEKCADGFLSCTSQLTAGVLWFYDLQKTDGGQTLSHNQSRHSCIGLEQILRNNIFGQGVKS